MTDRNAGIPVRLVATAVCLLLAPVAAAAQIPAPPQKEAVALVGGTVHTVAGETIEGGTVVFEAGRITAVGLGVPVPSGARSVDVRGRHIYPGLIGSLTSLGLSEIGAVGVTVDLNEQGQINPNVRAQVAFHPESEHIPTARSAGLLVGVSTPSGGLISGLSAAMMLDGWTWEEMTLEAPVALVVNWPNPARRDDYHRDLGEIRRAFAEARAYKIARDAERKGGPRHRTDSRWEAMMPVFEGDTPVMVRADQSVQIQDAVNWAEEEKVRLIVAGGRDAWRLADRLGEKDIPVLLTSVLDSPSRTWGGYDEVYGLPSRLFEAGVRFAVAGEPGAAYAFRLPQHAGAAIAFGLPPDEALKAVTLYPARILGLDDRLGSIEPGKDATLIVTDGDPLEYSTQVVGAYIQGRSIDLMDKHKRLRDRYLEKYRQVSDR